MLYSKISNIYCRNTYVRKNMRHSCLPRSIFHIILVIFLFLLEWRTDLFFLFFVFFPWLYFFFLFIIFLFLFLFFGFSCLNLFSGRPWPKIYLFYTIHWKNTKHRKLQVNYYLLLVLFFSVSLLDEEESEDELLDLELLPELDVLDDLELEELLSDELKLLKSLI